MCSRVIMNNKGNIVADDSIESLRGPQNESLEIIFKRLTSNVDAI